MIEGLDLSRWQATTPSLVGFDFLIARASVGLQADSRYGMHIIAARRAGLVTGAYCFLYGQLSIGDQVAAFLAAAGEVDLYAVDIEGADAPTKAQTAAAIALIHAAGKGAGLYHSDSGFFDAGQEWDWVANWSAEPARPWDIWQHRGSPLDLDRFDGTVDELRTLGRRGDTMEHPWEPTAAAVGQFTFTRAGNLIDAIDGSSSPRAAGYVRNVFTQVKITAGRYVGRTAWLGSLADRPVLCLDGLGAFVPTPTPAPDCSTVQHQLDIANARIHQAVTALGGTP